MDTIKFAIEQYVEEEYGFSFPVINIYINGRNLIDLVSEIENQQRGRINENSPRSSYIGFEVSRFDRFRNEMLGIKRLPVSILLTCTCTIEMCNCLMAKIAVEAQSVTWSELKSPLPGEQLPAPFMEELQKLGFQPVDYSELGPFVFDRIQYLSALDKVTQEWHLQNS
jgi:hypothetical protein